MRLQLQILRGHERERRAWFSFPFGCDRARVAPAQGGRLAFPAERSEERKQQQLTRAGAGRTGETPVLLYCRSKLTGGRGLTRIFSGAKTEWQAAPQFAKL